MQAIPKIDDEIELYGDKYKVVNIKRTVREDGEKIDVSVMKIHHPTMIEINVSIYNPSL